MKLTEDELKVLKLYRECESVKFYLYSATHVEADKFVGAVGQPSFHTHEGAEWLACEKGKIEATAFLEEGYHV